MPRTSSPQPTPVSGRRAASRGPAPLSSRQREVAHLIAHGLLNREISASLQISERTVESHVEAILRKLAFRRRTQIAIWAARQEDEGGLPRAHPRQGNLIVGRP
jgi:DNA-binding NarL/FixJ family response regulator